MSKASRPLQSKGRAAFAMPLMRALGVTMSNREIQAKTRAEMLAMYPIEGKLPGWYFRALETSNNAWVVEGSDVWGRKVARSGSDPETLLVACMDDATGIIRRERD